ncbi:MFS transporter [Reyranella massiliensis]|uniref:MFS transporter n=1 Tax=Reyranella massiliensis TaxID=445220 RepID=UPI0002F6CAA6|nr:MFS transporter [Reyranella massiliensis]
MIPVFRPLKDPAVATVWSGLAASTIGEDLFRVAVVWIAAEQIGNAAGYVNATQYAAMLVVGLLGASAFDRWRPDRAMIGSKYASAVMALLPVIGFYIWGVSIPLLVASVMGLAGLRMVFTPALQSAVPVLVTDRSAMQAINGLFDATWRLARLIGPMMAAILNTLLPVIHFLTITAVGFVLSALAIWAVRDRLVDPAARLRPGRGGWRGAWDALLDGARLMLRERTTGALLLVNAFANGPWSVALQLCIALMVFEHDPHLFGFHGLASLGLIVGSCGVGDVLGNLIAGSVRFRRPLSTMFLGYVAMGAGFALIALAAWGLDNPYKLPAMMAAGLIAGLGAPFFFIPMITRMQTVFKGAEIARVFRLRLAIMAGSMLFFNLVATPLFDLIGPTHTEFYLGLLLLALGLSGYLYYRRQENNP